MAASREAKVTFKADTSGLDSGIKQANANLKELRSQTKLVDEQMRTAGTSAEGLKQKQQLLAQQLAQASEKTELLRQKLQAAESAFGKDSTEAQRLRQQLNYAEVEEEKLKQRIQETDSALKDQQNYAKRAGESLQEMGSKMEEAGAKASVMSAAVAAAGKECLDAYKEVEEGANNVVKATGATGEEAKELEGVYKEVASEVVGDLGDIGSAVGEVQTRFGYTGDQLKETSEDFLRFSEVTGVDSVNAVKEVSRVMNAWGMDASRYPEVLDQVTKAAQATGISADGLLSSLDKNGTSFRELGFSTTEAIAILAEFEKEGVDASTALTGMKKAVASFAAEGKDAKTGFQEMFDGIKDGTVTTADAMEVFGTKAGPALVEAIKGGRFEYSDFVATLEGSQGTVEATFGEVTDGAYQNELAMQNMQMAMGEVGETVEESLTPVIEVATEGLRGFSEWWGALPQPVKTAIIVVGGIIAVIGPLILLIGSAISAVGTVMSVVGAVIPVIGALNAVMMANPIAIVVVAIAALIAILVALYNNCEEFRAFVDGMVAGIQALVQAFVDWFTGDFLPGIQGVIDAIAGFFTGLGETIGEVIAAAAAVIAQFGLNPFQNFHVAIDAICDFFGSTFPGLKGPMDAVRGFIDSLFSDPFGTLRDAVHSIISWVGSNFRLPQIEFPRIAMPHFWVDGGAFPYGIGGQGYMPSFGVDWYAKGGIFAPNSPRIIGVGDAKVEEAVAPLDRLQGFIETAVRTAMGDDGTDRVVAAIEALAARPNVFSVNGRALANATAGDYDGVNGARQALSDRGGALW